MRGDLGTGVALIALSLFTLVTARGLPVVQEGAGFGPGAFPVAVGTVLAVLGVVLAVSAVRRGRGAAVRGEGAAPATGTLAQPALIVIATAAYVALLGIVGFMATTVVYLFALTRIFGERSALVGIVYAVLLGVAIHQVFTRVLGVELPQATLFVR